MALSRKLPLWSEDISRKAKFKHSICIVSGIFGGVTSVIANCFSYVAALAEKEERTLRVSVVEGMQLVAAMAGPFLSKLIKQQLGTRAVFAGTGALN